jgi:hypothetical protein
VFLHNLLNVLVQFANKIGLEKKMSSHNNAMQNYIIKNSKEILKKIFKHLETLSNHYYMKKKQKEININGYLPPFSSVSHLLPKNVNNIKLCGYQVFFI